MTIGMFLESFSTILVFGIRPHILLINYITKSSKNYYARTSVRNESKLIDEKN